MRHAPEEGRTDSPRPRGSYGLAGTPFEGNAARRNIAQCLRQIAQRSSAAVSSSSAVNWYLRLAIEAVVSLIQGCAVIEKVGVHENSSLLMMSAYCGLRDDNFEIVFTLQIRNFTTLYEYHTHSLFFFAMIASLVIVLFIFIHLFCADVIYKKANLNSTNNELDFQTLKVIVRWSCQV